MVEDRITDGKRIAQLLASEVTGLERGPLSSVEVVDADRDAEPSPAGTFAYGVALDGERVADVFVHEETARIELSFPGDESGDESGGEPDPEAADETLPADVDTDGLDVVGTDEGHRITVEYGAAVKRAVDLFVARFDER